jgi:hypothetical protein
VDRLIQMCVQTVRQESCPVPAGTAFMGAHGYKKGFLSNVTTGCLTRFFGLLYGALSARGKTSVKFRMVHLFQLFRQGGRREDRIEG